MVQTWILLQDVNPVDAVAQGLDSSICGGCRLGPGSKRRTCYVNVGQAPLRIWQAWQAGGYDRQWTSSTFANRAVRLGAYGDPAAVPNSVWQQVTAEARSWTGYTHQARNRKLQDVLAFCQVSADTLAEAQSCYTQGYGSFRVLSDKEEKATWEKWCPAAEQQGAVQCVNCLLCHGVGASNIAIRVHGRSSKAFLDSGARTGLALPKQQT